MGKYSTREEFLEKAKLVKNHSGKNYDYGRVIYKRSSSQVEIVCPVHGPFWQTPNAHLSGYGCPDCGGSKKLTDAVIDERLSTRDILRLEHVSGVNNKTLWKCLKPHCGYTWLAKAAAILHSNTGCPKCAGNKPRTNQEVDKILAERGIRKLDNEVIRHGRTSFECLQPHCGHLWSTILSAVLSGTGCPKCAKLLPLTDQEVDSRILGRPLQRVDAVAGATTAITWKCTIDGYMWRTSPANILQGTGCPKCAGRAKLTDEIVDHKISGRPIKRLSHISGTHQKALWRCLNSNCGHEWWSAANSVMHKSGCPACAKYGFDPSLPSSIYVYNVGDTFCGYGITKNFKARHKTHENTFKKFGASWKIVKIYKCAGVEAQRIEKLLKNTFPRYGTSMEGFRHESTSIKHLDELLSLIGTELARSV